jgi:hypothetical protein
MVLASANVVAAKTYLMTFYAHPYKSGRKKGLMFTIFYPWRAGTLDFLPPEGYFGFIVDQEGAAKAPHKVTPHKVTPPGKPRKRKP